MATGRPGVVDPLNKSTGSVKLSRVGNPPRISLSRAYFDTQHEFISFEDPNDLFSMYLSQTQLSQVYFSITDDKGRLIEEVADGQSAAGNLSFKMSFKYDVLVDEVPPNDQPLQLKNLERQYPHLTMN